MLPGLNRNRFRIKRSFAHARNIKHQLPVGLQPFVRRAPG